MTQRNTSHYRAEPGDAAPAYRQVSETAAAMVAEGRTEEAVEFLLSALAAVLKKSRELELLLARMRRAGRSSERMDPGQLALLFEELLGQLGPEAEAPDAEAEARQDAELEAEIDAAKAEREASDPSAPKPKPEGRSWRSSERVERHVHTVEVPAPERMCTRCGGEKTKIGEDVSPLLEYVPGHFVEHEYRLEKWACAACKRGVSTAPVPAKVIPRSAADASLLAHVVVSKYVDHTPLHRLHRIYEREGVILPVSTLADWVAGVAERVQPLVERIGERIVGEAYVVSTDATGLRVLDPTGPQPSHRGTIWALVGDGKDVVFRYAPTAEGQSGPWTFLAGRTGYVQADAANVFDRLFDGQAASAVEVGCWAHARRKFVALQDSDARVAYPIKLITRLYRIERLADVKGLAPEERAALRGERSRRVLDTLHAWLARVVANEPPSSDFARACGYVLNHWRALTRFVADGLLELDNNLCERQLRDIALGRKNYLFAGSHDAAHRTAVLYSLMRTTIQHGVAPLPYLSDVLRTLANGSAPDLDELLPDRWLASRAPP